MSIIFGDGNGNFGIDSAISANTPYSVVSADFNSDGNADIAVATAYKVLIALGNGIGGFSATTIFGSGHAYHSISAADFNGDSAADLAMAGGGSNGVWILVGDGNGNFSVVTSFSAGSYVESVVCADFNNDNKIDLATANRFTNDISIIIGDGVGNFSSATNFAVGSNPLSIASADFNNDGKKDLAVVNSASCTVSVLEGNGLGSFSGAQNFAVDSFPNSISIEDYNGDGKMDLAVLCVYSNNDTGKVAVLLNCNTVTTNQIANDNNEVQIFPNPGKGIITIEFNSNHAVNCGLKIYNTLGENVYSDSQSHSGSEKINLEKLSVGIYFVKIFDEEKIYTKKIVIQ